MEVDFTIATRNSESTIQKCVESILDNVPSENLHHIVIIDNESTDSTRDIINKIKKKNKKVKLITQEGILGKVRLRQAEECDTEWIVSIDSDVFINSKWWETISPYFKNESAGIVFGLLKDKYKEPYSSFFIWSLKRFSSITLTNTAIRKESVIDVGEHLIKIHGDEDAFIFNAAKAKGRSVFFIKNIFVGIHEGDNERFLEKKMIRAGQSVVIKLGFAHALMVLIRILFTNQFKVASYALLNLKFLELPVLSFIGFRNSFNMFKGLFQKGLIRETG